MELGSSGTSENGRMPANKDITAFGKKGIQNLINRVIDDGTMLYFNNKKISQLPVAIGSNSLSAQQRLITIPI